MNQTARKLVEAIVEYAEDVSEPWQVRRDIIFAEIEEEEVGAVNEFLGWFGGKLPNSD